MTAGNSSDHATAAAAALGNRHLYLTGYRGSGKTTVGRMLAESLGRNCIDLDDEIERTAAATIREIFAKVGEAGFRDLESAALQRCAAEKPAVISLGGGAILRPSNRDRIHQTGVCVWLQIDADTVLQRLAADASTADRRPSLTGLPPRAEVQSLLEQRRPLYHQTADFAIDVVGRSIADITREILVTIASKITLADRPSTPSD